MKRLLLVFAGLGTAMVIVVLVLLSSGGLLSEKQGAEAQTTSRPNIVFVMTDDQAESTLRFMPNVQGLLTAKGRTFTNAFNVYPLCCPSRATIQRGQYAHNTQVFGNGPNMGDNGGYPAFDSRDLEKSTVATWLDTVGYRTIYFGKYMNYFTSQDTKPPGWDVFGTPTVPSEGGETKTATTANSAMTQLRQDVPKAEPVFLQVGFHAPHVPNDYESQYSTMFVGERVPRVPSFDEEDVSDKPRYIREDKPPLSQQQDPYVHQLCQDNEVNAIEQNDCEYVRQLRNLQTVDHFIKEMTDYLAAQGELSNTYIVYYPDNGNHWGEHRIDYGKMTPYETDTGFPLMMRGPTIPEGTTSNKLIGNHDIAPTFADIAGASTPPFVDGRSFLRIADADQSNDNPWRTALYVERRYKPEWPLPSKEASDQYVPPYEAVREENLLYVHHLDDPWTAANDPGFREFYNLSTDPYELRNLVYYGEVSQATLDRLEARLLRLRGCKAEECRAAEDDRPPLQPTDNTAPRVTSTSPANGATLIAPEVNVTATFTEAMDAVTTDGDPSTINGATVKLMRAGTTTAIGAVVSYDATTNTAILKPNVNLQLGTQYKAVVTTGAQDVAGNQLDQNPTTTGLQQKSWSFTVSN